MNKIQTKERKKMIKDMKNKIHKDFVNELKESLSKKRKGKEMPDGLSLVQMARLSENHSQQVRSNSDVSVGATGRTRECGSNPQPVGKNIQEMKDTAFLLDFVYALQIALNKKPEIAKKDVCDILEDFRSKIQQETLAEVKKILKLCPICKGTHGQWIKKQNILNKLGEMEKLK